MRVAVKMLKGEMRPRPPNWLVNLNLFQIRWIIHLIMPRSETLNLLFHMLRCGWCNDDYLYCVSCSQRSFRWEGSSDVWTEDPEPPGTPQEHCQSSGSLHLWRSESIPCYAGSNIVNPCFMEVLRHPAYRKSERTLLRVSILVFLLQDRCL